MSSQFGGKSPDAFDHGSRAFKSAGSSASPSSYLRTLYSSRFREFDVSIESVHWRDHLSQKNRFAQILEESDGFESLIDLGCGLADLWPMFRAKEPTARYLGIDIVPEFVDHSNAVLRSENNANCILLDAYESELPKGWNWVVSSGIFNNRVPDNWEYFCVVVERMFAAAEVGIVVNMLSSYVDYEEPDLFYYDPEMVLRHCRNVLGGYVRIKHDYLTRPGGYPSDFTVSVLKTPRVFGMSSQE